MAVFLHCGALNLEPRVSTENPGQSRQSRRPLPGAELPDALEIDDTLVLVRTPAWHD